MSAALDQLSAEDKALLDQMQADDAAAPPEPVADAPAPAEPTADAPAQTQPTEKPTMVDKRALDEERARRREAEQRYQAEQLKQAKLEERLELLTKAAQQHIAQPPAPATPPTPPVPAPKWEDDPAGFIRHGFETLGQRLSAQEQAFRSELDGLKQGTTQLTQAQQQQQAVAELDGWAAAQENTYRSEAPDYDAAMMHLRDARTNMMRLMGVPEHHIAQQIMNDVRGLANMARERGMNFAETLYKLAEAQGYRKAEAAPAAAAATPAPAANAAERLMRGQDMATTIGSTGAAPKGAPAASVLANMSDAEFTKLYADVSKDPARMRALFGE